MFFLPVLPLALEYLRQQKLHQPRQPIHLLEWLPGVFLLVGSGVACTLAADWSAALLWLMVPGFLYLLGGCGWGMLAARVFSQQTLRGKLRWQSIGCGLMLLVYAASLVMLTKDTQERKVVSVNQVQVLLETDRWLTADAEVFRREVVSVHPSAMEPSLLIAEQGPAVRSRTCWFGCSSEEAFPQTEEQLRAYARENYWETKPKSS